LPDLELPGQQRLPGDSRQAGIVDHLQLRHDLAGEPARLGVQAFAAVGLKLMCNRGSSPMLATRKITSDTITSVRVKPFSSLVQSIDISPPR
jgi:hypothetical protein